MKPVAFLAVLGTLALTAAPASTQTSPPPSNSMGTPYQGVQTLADSPYRGPDRRWDGDGCFDGRRIVGANRTGPRTVIVQPDRGAIHELQLAQECQALNGAEKIALRADGRRICPGRQAVLVSATAGGAKTCRVKEIRRLSSTEVAKLAAAAR